MKRHAYRSITRLPIVVASILALAIPWIQCRAQDTADSAGTMTTVVGSARPPAELDQLLGPIALYPDPLIGLILPAAAVPSQIAEADQYVSSGGDPDQISVQPWDPSVQGLAHYPTVLKWMDQNLAWTTEIGVAFTVQQSDVMDSIQRLRAQAQALGNLPTTPQENVVDDDGDIDIEPSNPDDMYIPDYSADTIYADPGVYCTFGVGLPIGLWVGYDWDWHHHHLIHWGSGHERPQGWWGRSPGDRRKEIASQHPATWRPQARGESIIVSGRDRGYKERAATRPDLLPKVSAPRSVTHPAVHEPREPAPRVSVTTIGRSASEPRGSQPFERSRPVERAEPSESAFGGAQSSREVRESSSRGSESRSFSSGSFHQSGGGGGSSGGGARGGGRR